MIDGKRQPSSALIGFCWSFMSFSPNLAAGLGPVPSLLFFKLPLKLSTLFCRCNDLLKNRDDSPSFLVTRLTAIRVLGTMYERLGRMTGRSYEETVQVLNKGLKNAESQARAETMIAFGENQYFTTYNLTSFMKKLSLQ